MPTSSALRVCASVIGRMQKIRHARIKYASTHLSFFIVTSLCSRGIVKLGYFLRSVHVRGAIAKQMAALRTRLRLQTSKISGTRASLYLGAMKGGMSLIVRLIYSLGSCQNLP